MDAVSKKKKNKKNLFRFREFITYIKVKGEVTKGASFVL